ncbi:hypothetical protein ACM46_08140 [Chryseobacterium angstadtii]|uniref:TonB C-terminal domain-containing protein n=1 Tax=Chryseobacterium angstadtii TaxID=558151 RepID=A0A0J7L9Y6_9FLAO|nr:hypothetical protein [Chryseobacterium angstadtii]KMQ65810.1 hypothetical protein ACM46_08140 [Chryseobacterium angstadtii]
MNNRFTSFLIAFLFLFLSAHKMEAQEKRKLLNGNILTEVKNIQKRFSDSISHYDYKKNSVLYSEKYRAFYSEKIQNLKNLYQSIYEKDVITGKFDTSILFKATNEIQTNTVSPQEAAPQAETKSKIVDIAQIENYQQLTDLKKRLTVDFPVYLIEDSGEELYQCKLNFIIDVDGKFKKIKYSGSSGTEFNIISALFLYAIGSLEKPLLYNKKPIIQQFSQPIIVRFE